MSASSAKKTCDNYFSKVVRARGQCERCGSAGVLECAHIIRRRFVGDPDGVGLRCNEDNAWALCPLCHRTVDLDPVAFSELVDRTIGREKYGELLAVRDAPHRLWRERDWVALRGVLLARLKAAA